MYGSYTPPEFIERDLGFDWYPGTRLDRLVDTTLQAQGFWLAVFVQGRDHVTGWLLGNLNRGLAWVDADSWAGTHARDDAWFIVTYLDGVSPGWQLSDAEPKPLTRCRTFPANTNRSGRGAASMRPNA